jgi:hypothetical protein
MRSADPAVALEYASAHGGSITRRGATIGLTGVHALLGVAGLALLAIRDWQTGSVMGSLRMLVPDTDAGRRLGGTYIGLAAVDTLLVGIVIVAALAALLRKDRASFATKCGIGVLLLAMGWYASWSSLPESGIAWTAAYAWGLLVGGGATGLAAGIIGYVQAPPLPIRAPADPPVPPSHEAG